MPEGKDQPLSSMEAGREGRVLGRPAVVCRLTPQCVVKLTSGLLIGLGFFWCV